MLAHALSQYSDSNGQARSYALNNTVELANLIPPTVSYQSRGHLLIIGEQHLIMTVAACFNSLTSVTLLANAITPSTVSPDSPPAHPSASTPSCYFSNDISINGYLGAFELSCVVSETEALANQTNRAVSLAPIAIRHDCFDIILDLSPKPIMPTEIPAMGYYHRHIEANNNQVANHPLLASLSAEIADLQGTFDKPKYFRLNNDLCAHSARGINGCNRCVDSCPTDALSSDGQQITINPYLCQGVGSCASACPTEAISYALPEAEKTQQFIHTLLSNYHDAGGQSPSLLFYVQAQQAQLIEQLPSLPGNVLPVALEEITSIGIDSWFVALAYGVERVLMLATSEQLPTKASTILHHELNLAHTLLTQLEQPAQRIQHITSIATWREHELQISKLAHHDNQQAVQAIAIQLSGSKRQKLFAALDWLNEQGPGLTSHINLPDASPYGAVQIIDDDCTLCMSCVTVCPTDALQSLGSQPGLQFNEQHCVQCGLCQQACPERVISLQPRINWHQHSRQQPQLLKQEQAACCLSCGKAYAPQSMVDMLINKLQHHDHFQGAAIKRLSMCEDCRVRDVIATISDDPESQLKV